MTPLMRLDVRGPVAALQALTSGNVDRPVGTVSRSAIFEVPNAEAAQREAAED